MSTIFEKIINRTLPCDLVFENDKVIAFKDIAPKAPIHILIVPKKVIAHLSALKEEDAPFIEEIFKTIQHLAKQFDVIEKGYRIVVNNGQEGGQTVAHLHFHFLAGRQLFEMG